MKNQDSDRRSLYILGWIAFFTALLYKIATVFWGISMTQFGLPCIFHALTGWYCPGCGGTRAVEQLLSGHIFRSLYYHPLVLYGAVLYAWFMISNTVEYGSGGRLPIGMRYKKWYVKAGIILVVVNFIIKNGVMLIWHYPMMA